MRRADRLFQIVQFLRARQLITAEQLADELRVSKRTVYRDIQDLQKSGVPIRGEAGVGYCLERGYELPPMTFNTSELEALVAGARVVEAWGDPALAEAARAALHKIEAVLPRPLRQHLTQTAIYAPRGSWNDLASGGLAELRSALTHRRKVRMLYARPDGQDSERVVLPVGLFFWGRTWSLAAWCELRGGWRNFRLDRVKSLEVLSEGFAESDGITLDAFTAAQQEADADAPRCPPDCGGGQRG